MNNNAFRFRLLEEVRCQCRFALYAYGQIHGHLQLNVPENVFFYTHAFVRHATDLGKVLWPANPTAAERGKMLCEATAAPERAPADWAALGATLDQFDAHLIAWYGNEAHHSAQPMNLMPVGPLVGFASDNFHRNLDPESMQFIFEGCSCNLRQIADVIRKIDTGAEHWLRHNNSW